MINKHGKLLLTAFILIIIGIALVQVIGDDVESVKVSSTLVANETVTISGGRGTLVNDEVISINECWNSTGKSIALNIACNSSTAQLAIGELSFGTINFSDNIAYVNYTYEPDTYVSSSPARTLLDLVPLFFVLAILAVGVGFAIKSFKESGVM